MELPKIEIPALKGGAAPLHIEAPGERASILIVDDNPAKLTALAAVVADMGPAVVTASSGREALRQLLARDFALILLDVVMPIMDGYETAQLIHSRPRSAHTPIIFITAEAVTQEERLKGYTAAVAVDWIVSPIAPEVLRSKVNVFVDLFNLNRIVQRQAAELKTLNAQLEEKVAARTAALAAEVEERMRAEDKMRESELWYRTLFALLPDAVVIVDAKGELVEFNDATCQQLGYSREDFSRLKITDLDASNDPEQIKEHISNIFKEGQGEFVTKHKTKEGKIIDVHVLGRALKLAGRKDKDVQVIFHDITELSQSVKAELEERINAERVMLLERELNSMAQFSPLSQTAAGKAAPRLTLSEASPEAFGKLVGDYHDLLDHAVERQAYKVDYDISGKLQALAREMAALKAWPRDVVEVHNRALQMKIGGMKPELKWAYIEEGRLMVLELMGYLANSYRR